MSLCHGSDLFHSIRLKLTVVSSPESPRELLSQFFFPHFSPSGLWLARGSLARRHHSVSVQMRSLILILSHLCGDGDGRGSKFFSSSLLRRCFLMWINEHCILNDHWISGRVFFYVDLGSEWVFEYDNCWHLKICSTCKNIFFTYVTIRRFLPNCLGERLTWNISKNPLAAAVSYQDASNKFTLIYP